MTDEEMTGLYEVHEITISARVIEEPDDDGGFEPVGVTVSGASYLAPSAIVDIAQEAVNSYFGSYVHGYMAIRPNDWPDLTDIEKDKYTVKIEKRG